MKKKLKEASLVSAPPPPLATGPTVVTGKTEGVNGGGTGEDDGEKIFTSDKHFYCLFSILRLIVCLARAANKSGFYILFFPFLPSVCVCLCVSCEQEWI